MEEIPLTTSEVVQVLFGTIIYYGAPLLLYCYLKYFRKKHEKPKS